MGEIWIKMFALAAPVSGIIVVIGSVLSKQQSISAIVLLVSAWIHPRRSTAAWLMVTGAGFMILGVGGLVWMLLDPPHFSTSNSVGDLQIPFSYGSLTIAVVLFSIGFLWDRIKRRRGANQRSSPGTCRLSGRASGGEVNEHD